MKAQKNIFKGDDKKWKENDAIYIYRVLTQVHTRISFKAMSITNSFVNYIFEQIAAKASKLAHCSKRSTITKCEMQTAVNFVATTICGTGSLMVQQICGTGSLMVQRLCQIYELLTDCSIDPILMDNVQLPCSSDHSITSDTIPNALMWELF